MSHLLENKRLGQKLLDTSVGTHETTYRTMIRGGQSLLPSSASAGLRRGAARVYFAREFPYHRPASRNFLE